jgi:hypothetical protein
MGQTCQAFLTLKRKTCSVWFALNRACGPRYRAHSRTLIEKIRMDYSTFSRQIFAVISAVHHSLEKSPIREGPPAPASWGQLQTLVRSIAEDLMTCADAPAVVEKLRTVPLALLSVSVLTKEAPDSAISSAIRRAYESSPKESPNLPGQAFAAFLIEFLN